MLSSHGDACEQQQKHEAAKQKLHCCTSWRQYNIESLFNALFSMQYYYNILTEHLSSKRYFDNKLHLLLHTLVIFMSFLGCLYSMYAVCVTEHTHTSIPSVMFSSLPIARLQTLPLTLGGRPCHHKSLTRFNEHLQLELGVFWISNYVWGFFQLRNDGIMRYMLSYWLTCSPSWAVSPDSKWEQHFQCCPLVYTCPPAVSSASGPLWVLQSKRNIAQDKY